MPVPIILEGEEMKKFAAIVVGALLMATLAVGCSYGNIAVTPANKVVVMRQDGFLFGALRKAFVCDVTDAGLTNCQTTENP